MDLMLLGAIATTCFIASLFFMRFWKTTHDRFFLFFAISFALEGGARLMLGLTQYTDEQEPLFYLIRLVAFVIILWAIIDKNWLRDRPGSPE
jgi:uncharacterized membrane protein HdeD (DUF308 family)